MWVDSSSKELEGQRDGQTVRVAGLVVVHQRPPTAKGHVFITLEDEEGLVNLIVRPNVYERYRGVLPSPDTMCDISRCRSGFTAVYAIPARIDLAFSTSATFA